MPAVQATAAAASVAHCMCTAAMEVEGSTQVVNGGKHQRPFQLAAAAHTASCLHLPPSCQQCSSKLLPPLLSGVRPKQRNCRYYSWTWPHGRVQPTASRPDTFACCCCCCCLLQMLQLTRSSCSRWHADNYSCSTSERYCREAADALQSHLMFRQSGKLGGSSCPSKPGMCSTQWFAAPTPWCPSHTMNKLCTLP